MLCGWLWAFNNVFICWGHATGLTKNCNINFPITFRKVPTLLGVGFVIEGIGQQFSNTTISGFTTRSNVKNCGTDSYMVIGF